MSVKQFKWNVYFSLQDQLKPLKRLLWVICICPIRNLLRNRCRLHFISINFAIQRKLLLSIIHQSRIPVRFALKPKWERQDRPGSILLITGIMNLFKYDQLYRKTHYRPLINKIIKLNYLWVLLCSASDNMTERHISF